MRFWAGPPPAQKPRRKGVFCFGANRPRTNASRRSRSGGVRTAAPMARYPRPQAVAPDRFPARHPLPCEFARSMGAPRHTDEGDRRHGCCVGSSSDHLSGHRRESLFGIASGPASRDEPSSSRCAASAAVRDRAQDAVTASHRRLSRSPPRVPAMRLAADYGHKHRWLQRGH
jgi:hypothetical protein